MRGLCVTSFVGLVWLSAGQTVTIPWWHPSIQHVGSHRLAGPATHSAVDGLVTGVLAAHYSDDDDHDSFDGANGLIRRPDWEDDHPNVDPWFIPAATPTNMAVSVGSFHPDVGTTYAAGTAVPSDHPSVHASYTAILPTSHPNIDTILADPANNPLPWWHPELSQFVSGILPITVALPVTAFHPNVDAAYAAGTPYQINHASVHPLLTSFIPSTHPNIDVMLQDPASHPLPDWHLTLESLLARSTDGSTLPSVSIAYDHPDIDASYRTGKTLPSSHPSIKSLLQDYLPANHPDVDMMMQNPRGYPLPSWHPPLNDMVVRRSFWSPGIIFAVMGVALLAVAYIGRLWLRESQTSYFTIPQENRVSPTEPIGKAAEKVDVESAAATSDHLHIHSARVPSRSLSMRAMDDAHRSHRAEHPMYEFERVQQHIPRSRVAKSVPTTQAHALWMRLTATRIRGTSWSTGTMLFCFVYIGLNALALLVATTYSIDRGLGSLAAANTMFLVVPATRNNILTWFFGLPFDHIILHHRFLGRVTVVLSLAHGIMYFDRFLQNSTEQTYWAGMAALCCGLGIAATTTDFVRRKLFHVFFWTHYLFIGFFAFSYVHVRQARPFLIVAVAIYALDKTLRFFWTLLPCRTTLFLAHGDRTVQVCWPKNPLTRLMGRHKVGQYVFVNFPELSLTEWHPFSVSSGPHEDGMEIHIRALGDHTRRIVALSLLCASTKRLPLIRSDGPYGYLDFSYRRYGMLLLAGGGIGITPIISMLKDVYGEKPSTAPHCMKHVYVVWVMPHVAEAELFMDTLMEHQAAAAADPTLPSLTVRVHCTRALADEVQPPVVAGRPDFASTLDEMIDRSPGTPTMVFACGPGRMVNQLWDQSTTRNTQSQRVEFHQESFEF
eukprot:m.327828 g.327828  ORF g.327828 m.327828 type:complete len:890 (+) comp27684_c0_seq1:429-3098(+)